MLTQKEYLTKFQFLMIKYSVNFDWNELQLDKGNL
jgi:hypothetical protein